MFKFPRESKENMERLVQDLFENLLIPILSFTEEREAAFEDTPYEYVQFLLDACLSRSFRSFCRARELIPWSRLAIPFSILSRPTISLLYARRCNHWHYSWSNSLTLTWRNPMISISPIAARDGSLVRSWSSSTCTSTAASRRLWKEPERWFLVFVVVLSMTSLAGVDLNSFVTDILLPDLQACPSLPSHL